MSEPIIYCKSRNLKGTSPSGRKRRFFRPRRRFLLHRHALGKVARFIDVTAKLDGKMIGEKLKRNDREYWHDAIRRVWQGDNFVGDVFELLRAISAGECNNGAFTSLDLLDVIQIFREDRIVGHDKNRGKIRAHQRDNAVLELGARVTFGEKIGDLLHFQGPFERNRKIELSPKKKHAVHIGVFFSNCFNLIAQFQNFLGLLGQCFQCFNDPASLGRGKISHPAEKETDESENDKLRSKGFRGRDADLWTGMHVNATVTLARDRARDVVTNSQRPKTFAPAFTKCSERIRSFAALADGKNQSLRR